jgi:hypothetical protein
MSFRPNSHWGSGLWNFLHTITIINYEDNEMFNSRVRDNLRAVANAIPCKHCCAHYKKFLEHLDSVDMRQPMVLFYWSVDLHNDINKRLGKSVWTYEAALEKWCRKV